ncbi:MAG: helix-turn-helix transcriptional regulator [Clostridia bacterium]|nr:helix-turn-helix transcriptional regulator [Clostridia bacterium]
MDEYRFKELGQFLKTRRARISPTQVGLPYGNRRRTPGLKREEVAQLANVSLTWYTWLEQGRPIKVSEQVLESIGHALLLDETEMQYVFMLSQLTMTEIKPQKSQLVSKPLQAVLDKLGPFPSFASDQYWNVIGWNASAKVIFGNFDKMNDRERNTIWRMFTNPSYKGLFAEWDKAARWIVSQFRLSCGIYASDQWFKKFVEELMIESNDFKQWWLEHNVAFEENFRKKLNVEPVGQLVFDFTSFDVSSDPRIKIAVHTPADEETFEKLKVLFRNDT